MLDWWKDLFLPVRATDSRFGPLRYLRDARFWEARVHFSPVDGDVEVLIHGSRSGPTDQQRSFFAEAERRYPIVWPAIHEHLLDEAKRGHANASEFHLVCVDVPEDPSPVAEWRLSYETSPPTWHFTVTMQNWQLAGVHAEC
jgi:hypothetical protein